VLSTVVVNIVQGATGANFLVWGWRIPFFLSALLLIVGLYIRLRILETPLFARVQAQKRQARARSSPRSSTAHLRFCSVQARVSPSRPRSTSSLSLW
jgi:MFS family permease